MTIPPHTADSLAAALAETSRPLFPIRDLQGFLERLTGTRPLRQTVHRWVRHGILAADGSRAFLRVTPIGGRRFVAREDLLAFVEALTGPRRASDPTPAKRARQAKTICETAGL